MGYNHCKNYENMKMMLKFVPMSMISLLYFFLKGGISPTKFNS